MYGFIVVNENALPRERLERYRGCYCGLCRALKQRHGNLCRLTLSYDMTFLVLLLSGMYEPEEISGAERCVVHPARRHPWWRSRFTDYAADLSVALAYQKCLDDYRDEGRRLRLAEAKQLRRYYDAVRAAWPRQCGAIERELDRLVAVESGAEGDPDAAANCFGRMMGELFVCDEDALWSPRLRRFGEALGRFIYMMDACVDLERDRKKGSYNPLISMGRELTDGEKIGILKMLIGECSAEFEALPIVQDADILRCVLYSGVWTRFSRQMKQEREDNTDGG